MVTGLGAITPIGRDMPSTWEAVLGKSICGGITNLKDALALQDLSSDQYEREWNLIKSLSCQVAASVNSDWINDHPSAAELQINDGRTSRFVKLALIAAYEAMMHSGLKPSESESFGVSIGSGMSSTRDVSMASSVLSADSNQERANRKISPHFVPRILSNSPSARVAIHNKLLGPNISHAEACAAGACAISHGVELIQSGRVKGMLVGGCESAVEALGFIGFSRLRALSASKVTAEYVEASCSRPFDSTRDGFVLSEGAAMLVLEEKEFAISRGANILAEVVGIGYSGDGFHITAPEPDGKGAARAMLNATHDAAIDMGTVDYINAHATSTPIGDMAEIRAIRLALSEAKSMSSKDPLSVSSTKGAMGHLLGASGAIEAAITVLSIVHQIVPHTQNLKHISDDILPIISCDFKSNNQPLSKNIHLVKHAPLVQPVNTAMSNSFGFGGTNVSLIFSKYVR